MKKHPTFFLQQDARSVEEADRIKPLRWNSKKTWNDYTFLFLFHPPFSTYIWENQAGD